MLLESLSSVFFLAALSALPASAETVVHDASFTPDYVLRVTTDHVPSACETRENVVVNGTSPGPVIRLSPGTRTWIRVYNDMEVWNLTMHWHGLSQRMAPFADGTPLGSQWPIPPGHFFDYEIATELEDAGTYFYHSHVEMQAMSCAGPLIVDDCGSAPFRYDDERILQFQDHFQKTDREIAHDLGAVPFVWPGETAGVVLNGRGVATGQTVAVGPARGSGGYFGSRLRRPSRGRYARALDSTDPSPDSAPEEPDDADASRMQVKPSTRCTLPVIDVEPGKTYRFRFIGATGLSFLTLGFEGHDNLTIIQADGHDYNAPVTTDHLQLGAGQRFDVLFNTKPADGLREDGSRSVYFLQFETLDRPNPYRGYGVLRYDPDAEVPAPPSNPVLNLSADHTSWLEYTLQPLQPERNQAPSAEEVTRRVVIDCEQKLDNKTGRVIWELGHLSWTEYSYQRPMLVDIYQRGEAALPDYDSALRNHGWDPATMSFPAKVGEVLEIVLQNTGSQVEAVEGFVETHPFHAHGKHYYDIGSGPGKYDADANNAKLARLGYRPVQRDTTMLFRYQERVAPGAPAGWRAWRMRVTDAGVWMVHCHLLAHMMMGMQSIWVVGDADQIIKIPPTVSQDYFAYGGSVYGNVTHAPTMYHYFEGTNKCGLPAGQAAR